MIDITNQQRLMVTTAGDSLPYIRLPEKQCKQVVALLDAHGIEYEVEDHVISINDGPERAFINLARKTDPFRVQQILDSVP